MSCTEVVSTQASPDFGAKRRLHADLHRLEVGTVAGFGDGIGANVLLPEECMQCLSMLDVLMSVCKAAGFCIAWHQETDSHGLGKKLRALGGED